MVSAIRAGRCIVTDGPVLNFTVSQNGTRAGLGEILTAEGPGAFEVNVQAVWTPEFGAVEQVEVFYYFRGMDETASQVVSFVEGQSQDIDQDLPSSPGYIRLATVTRNGGETYRCFTNPIWSKSMGDGARKLRVNCVRW